MLLDVLVYVLINQPIKLENEYTYAEGITMRKLSFYVIVTGMGVALSPLMSIYLNMYPTVIPMSIGISTFIFGSCAYLATKVKDVTMMKWKISLGIGLASLVVSQLVNIGLMLTMGPNQISDMLSGVDVDGGIVLFTGLSIYDSYMVRQMY